MVVFDIAKSLYFATAPPWSRKQGLVVKHKPHQTSPRLKAWQATFAAAARSSAGTRGRNPGQIPNFAKAVGDKLRGQSARVRA